MSNAASSGSAWNPRKVVFLDRDGTIIREPEDFRIDDLEKLSFLPYVISSLARLSASGFSFVMVSNQDGLARGEFTREQFDLPQRKMLEILAGEGVAFEAVFIDDHAPEDAHPDRKPNPGMIRRFQQMREVDLARAWMVGDRNSDAELAANVGCRSLTIRDPQSYNADDLNPPEKWFPTVRFEAWPELAEHILTNS